ncbi:unnamed protein product [Eruca vesicaria subsp. sativa]|uniref:Uncharacterized protein n=1 Tax=Eruca vesicaria subsp. sativa TaxID=29727 RepID=A0ABC8KYD3_ERUVS|nr:unnamed protein product [Eruca vesicaria subsp. sativa]
MRRLTNIFLRRMIVNDLDMDVLAKVRLYELKVLKLDKCSGFSLPMDFQHPINTAVEDHIERKKNLLSKDLGKVGLNHFFEGT